MVIVNGVKEKVKIICPIHGIFLQSPDLHINKGNSCPRCKASKGEKEIEYLLKQKKIKYISEHKFKNCKDKRLLSFDFYLPDINLCIEYDGIQHFKKSNYFWGEKAFNLAKKHDTIKNIYCENSDIKLLRIKYNENIKAKLIKYSII